MEEGWTCLKQWPYSHDAPEEEMDEDEMYLDHAEEIDDPTLPGWTVKAHTTNSGRTYKSFTSPQGEIYRSRVQAQATAAALDAVTRSTLQLRRTAEANSISVNTTPRAPEQSRILLWNTSMCAF